MKHFSKVLAASAKPRKSVGLLLLVLAGVLLSVSVGVTTLVVVLIPAFQSARERTRRTESENNLRAIGMALEQYAADHGTYPPAFLTDKRGKPIHSWRVLLLPYLGHADVYDQYHFDEPWDGPNNANLRFMMPDVYSCEMDDASRTNQTSSYLVVVGKSTAFPQEKTTSAADIADGLKDTVLVVEVHKSGINWMEPKDLAEDSMIFDINRGKRGINSEFESGAHVLTADGQVHFLREQNAPEYIQSVLTIDGGEIINIHDLVVD